MMKTTKILKYSLLIGLCFILIGCQDKEVDNKEVVSPTPTIEPSPTPIPYIDTNPVKVGLYQDGKLVKELSATIRDDLDIASFDVYFTNEENVYSSNTKSNFKKYSQEYTDSNKYKIGFYIKFMVGDKEVAGNILGPKNMYVVTPYIYNYLYDDVHQADGAWYSHVEENQVNDETIYSSIKLYAAEKTNEITSPITLMVYTYDSEDDFDDDGNYRGNSKYEITINRK